VPELRRFTILCVDDERIALAIRKHLLEKAGYIVLAAETAIEAMNLFRVHPIDLVITDHLLLGASGRELARELRAARPNLPVMLLSGGWSIPRALKPPDYSFHKLEGPTELIAQVKSIFTVYETANVQKPLQ
jgi:CheY-like chemotaxis protein